MIRDLISSLSRHVLTLFAGMGLGAGLYDAATSDILVNGGVAFIALIWSFVEKSKKSSVVVRKGYN